VFSQWEHVNEKGLKIREGLVRPYVALGRKERMEISKHTWLKYGGWLFVKLVPG